MKINVEVIYKHPNKITLIIGEKILELINDSKKNISASDIYKTFDYKIGQKYELKQLEKYEDINKDYQSYLEDVFELIDSIIKDFQ